MQEPQRKGKEKNFETRTKRRPSSAKAISWALLTCGVASLIVSIIYTVDILAFMGLGLTFWGALLLYLKTQEYTHKLLDTSVLPSLYTLNQLIRELDYKGNPVYLPPEYFENPEATKIYIPKREEAGLPEPEEIQRSENRLFVKNSEGILLTPPGAELTRLFERTLETSFTKLDLKSLERNLPKLFVEDLEIAENLEFEMKEDSIHLTITNSIYKDLTNLPHLLGKIGGPICSAIACAITKAAGKPVIIEKIETSEDGKTTDAKFRLLGVRAPKQMEPAEKMESLVSTQLEEAAKLYFRRRLLPRLVSQLLVVLGSIILVWVGGLTFYDMTVWGKDIFFIFFGSRTGEAMSLGVGVKVIHYFVLGLVLLVSGFIIFLRSRLEEYVNLYLIRRLLPNLVSLFLTAFGSAILAFIGWLIVYDVTVWNKDISFIFFGSRTGEAMSLGIGVKVIHYFVLGIALLVSGFIIFLRSKRGE
jgi:hypothetical protein